MATKSNNSWLDAPDWWRRWKPLRILALGLIGYFFYTTTWTVQKYVLAPEENPQTARYTAVEAQRVSLGAFQSYASQDSVRAALTAANFEWVETHLHAPPSELYPPHNMDTISVKSYRHLDNEGVLNLEFFNDRLYEVEFIPKDADSYARAVHASLPQLKSNSVGDAVSIEGPLRIASNVDLVRSAVGQTLKAHPYVIWQDLRLTQQRDQWDRDYGEMPIKGP